MSGKLEVSFNSPQCGWMSVGFANGENEFHTTTAHAPHDSALSELLAILTELTNENAEQNEYLLRWNRDPEEFDFHFIRTGGDLAIAIYQYPDRERNPANRELVFSHRGTIADVCDAFAETFQQLYADRNTDEFEFNWRQPFPYAEYEEFTHRIERG